MMHSPTAKLSNESPPDLGMLYLHFPIYVVKTGAYCFNSAMHGYLSYSYNTKQCVYTRASVTLLDQYISASVNTETSHTRDYKNEAAA